MFEILGLLIFILDIWALVKLFQSNAPAISKLLWALVIIIFPVLGLIIWFLMGPRR